MAEFRLSPVGGWDVFAARMVHALALGGAARGIVAQGLPRRMPEVYEQRLADVGTAVATVAISADVMPAAELLVDRGPFPPDPIAYV